MALPWISLNKLVLVGTNSPYLLASSLGEQEPSPLASLRGTKGGQATRAAGSRRTLATPVSRVTFLPGP